MPCGMLHHSSLTRDWVYTTCSGSKSLNRWTTRKPLFLFLIYCINWDQCLIWVLTLMPLPNFNSVHPYSVKYSVTCVFLIAVVVHLLSRVWLVSVLWTAAHEASLSFTIGVCSNSCPLSWWWHPTISSSVTCLFCCLQSFPASVFSNELALHIRWPEYWSFSISPSSEYSGLISFRIDWFTLLAVQRTLKSLFCTTVQRHQFFGTQPFLLPSFHIHTWLLKKS